MLTKTRPFVNCAVADTLQGTVVVPVGSHDFPATTEITAGEKVRKKLFCPPFFCISSVFLGTTSLLFFINAVMLISDPGAPGVSQFEYVTVFVSV